MKLLETFRKRGYYIVISTSEKGYRVSITSPKPLDNQLRATWNDESLEVAFDKCVELMGKFETDVQEESNDEVTN